MSRSLNRAELIGHLGQDPEVRSTSSGTRVANLSLATNRTWKDSDGREQERVEWHRLVCWEGLAEVCEEYLSKGDRVYVDGRIEYREWEDDEGRTRHTTEIRVDRLIMLGSSSGGGRGRRGPRPEDRESAGPSREDKQVDGARRSGPGELDEFDEDELLGDDSLPF